MGQPAGRRPRSAIVRTGMGTAMVMAVSTRMQISGEGTAWVTRGTR
jgi:hypothetical protein